MIPIRMCCMHNLDTWHIGMYMECMHKIPVYTWLDACQFVCAYCTQNASLCMDEQVAICVCSMHTKHPFMHGWASASLCLHTAHKMSVYAWLNMCQFVCAVCMVRPAHVHTPVCCPTWLLCAWQPSTISTRRKRSECFDGSQCSTGSGYSVFDNVPLHVIVAILARKVKRVFSLVWSLLIWLSFVLICMNFILFYIMLVYEVIYGQRTCLWQMHISSLVQSR